MARAYKIRDGHAFVLDGHRMHGGERIVLEDDVAAMHADKIDPIDGDGEAKPKRAVAAKKDAKAGKAAKSAAAPAGDAPDA